MDYQQQFADEIRAAGLTPPDTIEPGKFHRFPGIGKRNGNKAGWCKLFADGIGGTFGDFSQDFAADWQAKRESPLTLAEREGFRQQVEKARAEADAERTRRQAEARELAGRRFNEAHPADAAHPYLVRKGVKSHGLKQEDELLLVPMRDGDGLHSLQTIDARGEKRFLPGGRVAGCYHSFGTPAATVCIAEGYATGASIHEATDFPVAVALFAGNLEAVARTLRARMPDVRIIVCADDDAATTGNPGLTKAHAAARAADGLVAVPDFGADRPEGATDFNDLAAHLGAEAVREAVERARAPDVSEPQPRTPNATAADSDGGEWPEPQPLVVAEELAPYPLDALPTGVREAVAEVLDFVQCPPALAACSALSALSLAGQALANVRRAERLEGPTSLYLLAVGESGERKSTCDGYFLSAVREWESEQAERTRPDAARHTAVIAAWEERKAGIKARIREASKKGDDYEAMARELADIEAEAPQPFRVPQLIHADTTPEALAWSLARGWPTGGVMSAEAGIVFGGHGMGRDSVMRNLSLLNALWDGATHRVERRTSESFTLAGIRLTMGLAAQPETVRQFLEGTKSLARGSGFAARFLIAAPQSTQGRRRFREAGAWRHVPAFAARLRELLDMTAAPDESGGLSPPVVALSADARAAWQRFHNDVEDELRPGGEMHEVRDVASKAADNVARMAALFHLYAHGPTGQVEAEAVQAAARIVGWHLYQARAFLGEVAAPRELSNARKLDTWLIDRCARDGIVEVPRRMIQNEGPNPVRNKSGLAAALAELVEAGRVRVIEGRRKLVLVNPALLGDNDGAS
jgi:putative DNA primase/helicase